jgi:hypothetical protein
VPIDSSKRTLTLGGAPCASMGSQIGRVCAFRCRMNSRSGSDEMTDSNLALASAAPTSDMSMPLTAVALIWTRLKPRSRRCVTNDASPRRTSSTRDEQRCAARRAVLQYLDRDAERLSTHSGDA